MRWIPAEDADAGKRLKSNLQDLWASGNTTSGRHVSLMKDALEAGVESCYSRVAAKQAQPSPEALYREALKGGQWPKLQIFNVPLKAKNNDVREEPLAFLCPHDLIHQLVIQDHRCLQVLQDTGGLDETGAAHIAQLAKDWCAQPIPVSLWQDGVPFNWDRSESLEVFSISFPGLSSGQERNLRFPVTVLPHSFLLQGHFSKDL